MALLGVPHLDRNRSKGQQGSYSATFVPAGPKKQRRPTMGPFGPLCGCMRPLWDTGTAAAKKQFSWAYSRKLAQKVRKSRIPTASLRPIAPKNRPRAPRSRPCAGLSRRPVGRRWQRNRTDFTARAQCRLLGTTLPYTWRFGPTAVTGLDSGVCVEFRILLTGKPQEIVLIKSGVLCWLFLGAFRRAEHPLPSPPPFRGRELLCFFWPPSSSREEGARGPSTKWRSRIAFEPPYSSRGRRESEVQARSGGGRILRVRPRHRDTCLGRTF